MKVKAARPSVVTSTDAESPALELSGLSRRYGAHFVLRDVNLRVSRGRVVVLRGGNGAGKTTLLRVLSTRLRPSRGGGRVFGFDLATQGHEIRKRVAYLNVLGGAYGTLTAQENLAFSATLYGKRLNREEVAARLEQVGLGNAQDKLVRTFSSGMKKRLGVARLLLADADLWLLDEPYAALDESGKTLIEDLVRDAKAEGRTVIMASHDLGRSRGLADSVLGLENGRLSLYTPQDTPQKEAQTPEVARV